MNFYNIRRILEIKFSKWALIGIITNLIDYFVFLIIFEMGYLLLVANFIAGVFSISFNYLGHYWWSFKSQQRHIKSSFKYFLNFTAFWLSNTLMLKGLISADIEPRIAKLIPILFLAPLSFLSLNLFVFKGKFNN